MMKYTVNLDVAFDEDETVKNAVDELIRGLRVFAEVVIENGPAGGWPVVRFASNSRRDLETVVDRYWSEDAEEAEWAKDELIVES